MSESPEGQSVLEGRVPRMSESPEGEVPRREECPDGQGAQNSILPQREKSTESLRVLKGLNSEKRGRGSRTTITRTRTVILTTRSARLRRQLKINQFA